MKTIATACCIFICIYTSAQHSIKTEKQARPVFQSILQGGLLAGEDKPAYQLQSINGFQYKTFFAGAGVGIDNYVFRSVPVFIDVRKDIFNKPSTPFVFADAGWQFAWVTKEQKGYYYTERDFSGKLYFNAGAGYQLTILKHNAITFSAAFSLKRIDVKNVFINPGVDPYCPGGNCAMLPVVDKYTLRRLSLLLGWTIW